MKPIVIDRFTELCPKCMHKVAYARGTGRMFYGANESYEDWEYIEHNFCPHCGEKIERGEDEE